MNKKKVAFIGGVVLASVTLVLSGIGVHKYKVNKELDNKIKVIEDKIANGEYENVLSDLEEIKSQDIGVIYKNIITDFLAYRSLEKSIAETQKYLEDYKVSYVTYIGNYPFEKLSEDIDNELEQLKLNQEAVDEKVQDIKLKLEEGNIEEVKVSLDNLIIEFPLEDFSELSNLVDSKIQQKEQEEQEEQQRKQEEEERLKQEKEKEKEEKNKQETIKEEKPKQETTVKDEVVENKPVAPVEEPVVQQPIIAQTKASKNSSQLITVVGTGGSYAELKLWQKNGNGLWTEEGTVSARLGRNGLTDNKREGDGCTPTGIYSMGEAFGLNSNPGTTLSYRKLDGSEYWVDDVNSQYYNTMQFGSPNGRWNSAEHLAGMGTAYNYSIVVDYNRYPVTAGKGSAIFLHVSTGNATAGCISVPQSMMVKILNWINGGCNPKIIITSSYDSLVKYY